MTYTGMQMAGWTMMCLAAGIGIGAIGMRIVELMKLPDCEKCEEAGNPNCPYWGEPDGCNNHELRAKVRGWGM